MSERILVGTRKGAFDVDRISGQWKPSLAGHPGVGVNFVARDPHQGTLWALLVHGHWGAKLSRSSDERALAEIEQTLTIQDLAGQQENLTITKLAMDSGRRDK